MGKTIFAAVIAAILASIATVLVMGSLGAEKQAADSEVKKHDDEVRQVERERIERRITELEKRVAAAPRGERRPSEDRSGDNAAPPPLAPDGTPYVSRAELEAFALKYVQGLRASQGGAATDVPVAPPIEKKSLEDIARDMSLSAGEEANLRNILRAAEEEMLHNICGERTIDEVKREVKEAKEDPDKMASLAQEGFGNAIRNVGKIATWDSRLRLRVEKVIGPERATTFLAKPRKPVLDADLESLLQDWK